MNDRERAQIQRILNHWAGRFAGMVKQRLRDVYSTHSAVGRLQSGATIKVAVREMASSVDMMLDSLEPKVRAISAESDAFALLSNTINQLLDVCAAELPNVVSMACGRCDSSSYASVQKSADALYDTMRADFITRLEILSFDYESVPKGGLAAAPAAGPKKGGRPPADFWDDMWASIAASLYEGDLVPKSQAEIERAMTAWIEGRGQSAAVSTVRARARRLWDRIAPHVE